MTPFLLYGLLAFAEPLDEPTPLEEPVSLAAMPPKIEPKPLRMSGWILAEQMAIFGVDGWVARPPEWTDPQWSMFERAWNEPTPHWDNDGLFTNGVLHPVMGAHFYMAARNHGFSPAQSAMITLLGSFTWEYVIESWFTPPVVWDLVATPMLGVPLGIALTHLKKPIRNIRVKWLRGVVMLPVDPLEGTDILLFGGPPRTTTW
jgi:hypothetical protein